MISSVTTQKGFPVLVYHLNRIYTSWHMLVIKATSSWLENTITPCACAWDNYVRGVAALALALHCT